MSGFLGKFGLRAGPDSPSMAAGFDALGDGDARRAFLHTAARGDRPSGQRVDATDRLYLAEDVPSLIVWGGAIRSSRSGTPGAAQRGMPGSRLEVFDDAGHFPQLDEPARFARTLADFVETTEPAEADADLMRARLVGS